MFWFQVHNTPLIFYTPNSLHHNSIRPIFKILKYILHYLAHLSQSVNTPHPAIQHAWDDLPIKTIKYQVTLDIGQSLCYFRRKLGRS